VNAAAVNLATEKATVEFDPTRVTFEQLQTAVSDSGYSLKQPEVERTPDSSDNTGATAPVSGHVQRLRLYSLPLLGTESAWV
jgi:cation transport ATPase